MATASLGPVGPELSSMERAYEQTSTTYRAIDDFRAKLLGFLPIASAGGVFLLVEASESDNGRVLAAAAVFGFVVTLGLLAYEIYGIKRCHLLIEFGRRLELDMHVKHGPFQRRPREVAGYVDEPFATALIYPAVLAGWTFVGIQTTATVWAAGVAVAIFTVGFALIVRYDSKLRCEARKWRDAVKVEPNADLR
jgi:hypothetical protein